MDELRRVFGVTPGDEWAGFAPGTPEAAHIRTLPPLFSAPPLPGADRDPRRDRRDVSRRDLDAGGVRSSPGRAWPPAGGRRARDRLRRRRGHHAPGRLDEPQGHLLSRARGRIPSPTRPRRSGGGKGPAGQHVEIGIAEHDLFLLLAALGLTAELSGQTLLPIGTLYDPFVTRGLDALYHALYCGARFIVVATPSGITLAPEGGAHQSVITPGIGVALPDIAYYEPAFAREVEWILLAGLRAAGRAARESLSAALSTAPVDQRLAPPAEAGHRGAVLAGGYRLIDGRVTEPGWHPEAAVHLFAAGVGGAAGGRRRPAPARAGRLRRACSSSPAPIASTGACASPGPTSKTLVGADEEDVPVVSVLDGHSHALAFLGGALGVPQLALGVDYFGQSGTRQDLYRHYGIDADAIVRAAARTFLA